MALKKQFLKNKPVCKVKFSLPAEAARDAREVFLVGDFNGWDKNATPMRRLKDGSFILTLDLETNRENQFRYLVDGERWENDWEADKYVYTPFGDCDNSVVIT